MSRVKTNNQHNPTVVVIGGGATGTGIARDAALRDFNVVLVERGELGSGTSSHFHGILHSGGRYAVNDLETARECYAENRILRKIAPTAIRDTGGLFLAMTDDEAKHAEDWLTACMKAEIPVTELSREQAIAAEPHISHAVQRAFKVPDGYVSGAEITRLNRQAAERAETPATFLTGHNVIGFDVQGGRICSIRTANAQDGSIREIPCDYVINATGVWAGEVSQYAGVSIDMVFDKGTMIVFKYGFTQAVLNRCRPENDGDLLVPGPSGSIMGTTARHIDDPNKCQPTQEEVDVLIREGSALVPQLAHAEASFVYAGVRPLFNDGSAPSAGSTRGISRSFHVLDHAATGVENFISVVGGKVTTYRKMAEAAVDLVCTKSGVTLQSQTAEIVMGQTNHPGVSARAIHIPVSVSSR